MAVNEHGTKRDPRVKRTNKLLRQTFQELLEEKNFRSITVQDIVDRAEINRATFYTHFEDKFALLDYSVRESLQEAFEKKCPDVPALTVRNLRLLAITVCEFTFSDHCHPSNRNLGPVLFAPRVQQFVYETLVEWFTETKDPATFQITSPEQAAVAISSVISGGRLRWLRSKRKQTSEQFVDEMVSFLAPLLSAYFVVDFAYTE